MEGATVLRSTTFGAYLRQERKRRGWLGEDLAQRLGVSRQWVSWLETSERHVPRQETVQRLAVALGVTAESLEAQVKRKPRIPDELRERIIELYRNPNVRVSKIRRLCGCGEGIVRSVIREAFGPIGRGSQGQRRERLRRGVVA